MFSRNQTNQYITLITEGNSDVHHYIPILLIHIRNSAHTSFTFSLVPPFFFIKRLPKSGFHSLLFFHHVSLSAIFIFPCLSLCVYLSLCLWRRECIIEKRSRFLCHVDDRDWGGELCFLFSMCVCVCVCVRWGMQLYCGTASQRQNRGRGRFQDVGQSYTNWDTIQYNGVFCIACCLNIWNETCVRVCA